MPEYLTADELKRLFPHASQDCIQRSCAVDGLQNPKRQCNQRRQGQDCQLDKSKEGVAFRVVIISIRRKLADAHENFRQGCKPLVDRITESLGFAADDNPRLQWEYHQLIGKPVGTIIVVERL